MKKCTLRWLLSLALVLALCSACFLPAYASGDTSADKPTKAEIQAMWRKVTSAAEIYDETPSTDAPYKAGKLDAAYLQTGLTMANYVRFVANLPLLELDDAMNEDAQHGAVLMAAEDQFGHYPPQPADMDDAFYQRGRNATSSSNIFCCYGYPPLDALKLSVSCFMNDEDISNNDRVGHRRWILNPTLKYIGFGYATSSSWQYVDMMCHDRSGRTVDYDFIAWPAEGNFPTNLIYNEVPWSITLNPQLYKPPKLDSLKITLTRVSDGKTWNFDSNTGTPGDPANAFLHVDNVGYGVSNCIIFNPGSSNIVDYEGVFTVDVSGIYKANGAAATLHYEVDFFDVEKQLQDHTHDLKVEEKNPSCTTDGYVKKTCTGCDYESTEILPALGHSWGGFQTVTEPSCNKTGSQERSCTICGTTEAEEIPALNHIWSDFQTVTEPSCNKTGSQERSCTNCGTTETEEIAALEHSWGGIQITVKPSCTEPGLQERRCTNCGAKEAEELPALDHVWNSGEITQEPTQNSAGERLYTCTRCGETRTEEIPKLSSVSRISGKTRYQTSLKIADAMKDQLGVDQFDHIIVASGEQFPDALAGSYLGAVKKAPILLVNLQTTVDVKTYIRANVKEGGTVYLLGGKAAVAETMEAGLDDYDVQRLSGKTRYETNLAILGEAGVGDQEILVCTGAGFADSLSASAAGRPILLVGSSLTAEQKIFLAQENREFVIIGGTGAVSEKLENQLKDYGTVERVRGKNRYETSVWVANRFFKAPDSAVLAYGQNFPDGLCGGPLAISMKAPLILTATGDESAATQYTKAYDITRGSVLGGAGLISDASARTIFQMASDEALTLR